MRFFSAWVYTFFLMTIAVGCAAAPSQRPMWNVVPAQARVAAIARDMTVACTSGHAITVNVFNSSALAAYSWPDGRILISRGLTEQLDDQELAAVIAHEMGHLLSAGTIHTIASLRGCNAELDVEKRADALGVQLLRARGIPRQAMIRMLTKVEFSHSLPRECRPAIQSRIAALIAQQN